jgi:hypothetical protein
MKNYSLSEITADYYKILINLQECNNNLINYIHHLEKENHSLIKKNSADDKDLKIQYLQNENEVLIEQNQSLLISNQLLIDQNVNFLLSMNL